MKNIFLHYLLIFPPMVGIGYLGYLGYAGLFTLSALLYILYRRIIDFNRLKALNAFDPEEKTNFLSARMYSGKNFKTLYFTR